MHSSTKKSILKLPRTNDPADPFTSDFSTSMIRQISLNSEKKNHLSTTTSDSLFDPDDFRIATMPSYTPYSPFSPTNSTLASTNQKRSKVMFKINGSHQRIGSRHPSPEKELPTHHRVRSDAVNYRPSSSEPKPDHVQPPNRKSASPPKSKQDLLSKAYKDMKVPLKGVNSHSVLPIEAELNFMEMAANRLGVKKAVTMNSKGNVSNSFNQTQCFHPHTDADLMKELEDARMAIHELKKNKKQLETKLQRVELEKASKVMRDNEQLKKDNTVFFSKNRALDTEIDKLKSDKLRADEKYNELQNEYNTLTDDHEKMVKSSGLYKTKIYNLEIKMTKLNNELESLKQKYRTEVDKLTSDLTKASQKIASLIHSLEDMNHVKEENSKLKYDYQQLTEVYEKAENTRFDELKRLAMLVLAPKLQEPKISRSEKALCLNMIGVLTQANTFQKMAYEEKIKQINKMVIDTEDRLGSEKEHLEIITYKMLEANDSKFIKTDDKELSEFTKTVILNGLAFEKKMVIDIPSTVLQEKNRKFQMDDIIKLVSHNFNTGPQNIQLLQTSLNDKGTIESIHLGLINKTIIVTKQAKLKEFQEKLKARLHECARSSACSHGCKIKLRAYTKPYLEYLHFDGDLFLQDPSHDKYYDPVKFQSRIKRKGLEHEFCPPLGFNTLSLKVKNRFGQEESKGWLDNPITWLTAYFPPGANQLNDDYSGGKVKEMTRNLKMMVQDAEFEEEENIVVSQFADIAAKQGLRFYVNTKDGMKKFIVVFQCRVRSDVIAPFCPCEPECPKITCEYWKIKDNDMRAMRPYKLAVKIVDEDYEFDHKIDCVYCEMKL